MAFSSSQALERFVEQDLGPILGRELEEHPYNTMGSFLAFYHSFLASGCPPLLPFFQGYQARVLPFSLSCVGLSLSLINAVVNSEVGLKHPALRTQLCVVSCEEMVGDVEAYCGGGGAPDPSSAVKEHVLVALRVAVAGEGGIQRPGVVLLDPGYSVGRPAVAMADGRAPHTGWFLQAATPKSTKEYCYSLLPGPHQGYVAWRVKDSRRGTWTNLIYIQRPFLDHVAVSEKRNLAFNFRTFVKRDRQRPVAGLYCNLEGEEQRFTLFYQEGGARREVHIPFSEVEGGGHQEALGELARQTQGNVAYFQDMMAQVVGAHRDARFTPGLATINHLIDEED